MPQEQPPKGAPKNASPNPPPPAPPAPLHTPEELALQTRCDDVYIDKVFRHWEQLTVQLGDNRDLLDNNAAAAFAQFRIALAALASKMGWAS